MSASIVGMNACNHTTLELLPEKKKSVRCRACHLTLPAEELQEGFCPECFDVSGTKRYDFEEVISAEEPIARYRCEKCGVIVATK